MLDAYMLETRQEDVDRSEPFSIVFKEFCGKKRIIKMQSNKQPNPEGTVDYDNPFEEPDHPIINEPWEYKIIEFKYHRGHKNDEPHIDLTLKKNNEIQILRFRKPSGVRLYDIPEHEGPSIKNVTGRGFESVQVAVCADACGQGHMSFWAEDVIDITES